MQKPKTKHNIQGNKTSVAEKVTSVAIITINNAIIESNILVKLDKTLDNGNIYLGKYTFFISAAPPKIELIAILVDSAKNPKISCPANK